MHERAGRPLPFVVDPRTGEVVEPRPRGPARATCADWYARRRALLVRAEARGRSTLHRVTLDGELTALPTPPGTIGDATARPDGTVEYSWSSAAEPTVIRSTAAPWCSPRPVRARPARCR
jgi:hypothetical protein